MEMKIQPIKNVWDTAKAELRRQPIALSAHVRNKKFSNQFFNFLLKRLQKAEQNKTKVSRMKIINVRAEVI